MAKIIEEQEVKLFSDEDKVDTQSVVIDTGDPLEPWMIVSHCGEELSMSLTNWNKLIRLVNKAKAQILKTK